MRQWILAFATFGLCAADLSLAGDQGEQANLSPSYYTMAPITQTAPGNFGNTRLYFQEACNQSLVSVLTEATGAQSFNVGLLTKVYVSGCNRPAREQFTTLRAHGAELTTVVHFEHVWHCESSCTTFYNGRTSTYFLDGYGTSREQANDQMACNGISSNLMCGEIEIRAAE